jgi:hypothetical protein
MEHHGQTRGALKHTHLHPWALKLRFGAQAPRFRRVIRLLAKSAEASLMRRCNALNGCYLFLHGQGPCLNAGVRFGTQAWSPA